DVFGLDALSFLCSLSKAIPLSLMTEKRLLHRIQPSLLTLFRLKSLNYILNNPRLMEKMYFDHDIETSEKSELWHGDIWQRSPLYGDATISIDNGKTRSMTLFGKTLLICFQ